MISKNTHNLYKIEIYASEKSGMPNTLILDTEFYSDYKSARSTCGELGNYYINIIKKFTNCDINNKQFSVYESRINENGKQYSLEHHVIRTDNKGDIIFTHINVANRMFYTENNY